MEKNPTDSRRKPFKCIDGDERWIGGVCGGIAYAFGVPVLIVRIVTFIVFLLPSVYIVGWISGVAFVLYLVAAIFAPNWERMPSDYQKRTR